MGRGGRYRVIPTVLWESTDFQKLSPNARFVLLNLKTGSMSSFPGIGLLYGEALQRETGLQAREVESALGELEKASTTTRSWIVRDRGVVWVRDQLESDPAIEKSNGVPNEDQKKGIETILGSLPQDSAAVQKFRNRWAFRRKRVKRTVTPTAPKTVTPTGEGSPAVAVTSETFNPSEQAQGRGERERGNQDQPPAALSGVAPPADSNTDKSGALNEEILQAERRLYGRELTVLQRKGRHPLPARLREG